tara:strand:- start:7033 stop:7311 length:279 start_codon:yes stop_codon:yes gene_type:complete
MSRIEDEVCKKIQGRAEVGKNKYGVTMETAPLSKLEWLIHAQEEAMDLAVYLQKLIEEINNTTPNSQIAVGNNNIQINGDIKTFKDSVNYNE